MEDWLKIDNDTQVIDTSDIVITAGYNAKFEKIEKKILNHNKYITNNDFNNFPGAIFDDRSKQAKLAAIGLKNVEQHATRNEEKTRNVTNILFKFFYL